MIISEEVKVRIRNSCSIMSIEIYVFLRFIDSVMRWFWLAMSMSGRSQVVRIKSGADRASEKNIVEWILNGSEWRVRRDNEIKLIKKLWRVVLVQINGDFDNHVNGRSITVGIKIFSIVVS